jgi:hypothetical protein
MVESIEEEISPASLPPKNIFNWHNSIIASNTEITNDGLTVVFQSNGGFRYCRSEQEFTDGYNRVEIEVDFEGKDGQVSFGISNDPALKCDAGVYYFTNAYIYCNYYPSFTKDYNNIHKITPDKLQYKGTIAVEFDFDSKTINWEINGKSYEKLDLQITSNPFYIVVGMFTGKATFT